MKAIAVIPLILVSCSNQNSIKSENDAPLQKTTKSITIDGILTNSEWKEARLIDDFRIVGTDSKPVNKTDVFITYDSAQIYVAFKGYADSLKKDDYKIYPKDDLRNALSDWVGIGIDGYGDGLNAKFFMSNPVGGQVDGHLSFDGRPAMCFSTEWKCAGHINSDHYFVEMAIPFEKLPFKWKRGQVDMDFKLARFDSQHGEEADYPKFTDQTTHLSQFEKIRFEGIVKNNPKGLNGIDLNELTTHKLNQSKVFDIQTLEGRSQAWGEVSVIDYKVFKSGVFRKSSKPCRLPSTLKESFVKRTFMRLQKNQMNNKVDDFDFFLERTETAAFLVILNDTVVYEKYYNGFARDSVVTSFSVAKSFASVLLGMAIADGYVSGEDETITKYIPELLKNDKRFERIKIRDLIAMSSGLRYEEGGEHSDDVTTYYHPDLRKATFEGVSIQKGPGQHFLYNNFNPLLLGIILERATGKSVISYMQEKIWEPLGMEYDGSWSLDEKGFAKMESGINARPIDFAKFGLLMLKNGKWRGSQVVSENWVMKSTQPQSSTDSLSYPGAPFFENNSYYGWFWWGIKRENGASDFFGLGNKGQYIYISPQKNLVIVRNGIDYGMPLNRWTRLFYDFASNVKAK